MRVVVEGCGTVSSIVDRDLADLDGLPALFSSLLLVIIDRTSSSIGLWCSDLKGRRSVLYGLGKEASVGWGASISKRLSSGTCGHELLSSSISSN